MRTIKLILLALILVAIVVLSLANRESVVLNLLPEGMSGIMPLSLEVPLFVLSLVSILVGMVLGYLLEWFREHKHRKRASIRLTRPRSSPARMSGCGARTNQRMTFSP